MKIAVFGAGMMGRAALFDLSRNNSVEQSGIFDIDESLAAEIATKFGSGQVVSGQLDATDGQGAIWSIWAAITMWSKPSYK